MSGPKISVYSLTGRAKTIVFGQMRCEQQSLVCAAQTQEMLRSLQSFSGNFDQQIANIRLLMKRTSEGAGQLKRLEVLQKKLKIEAFELQQQLRSRMPHASAKYRITEEAYAEKQAELRCLQSLYARAKELKDELDATFQQDQKNTCRIQASILRNLEGSDVEKHDEPNLSFTQREKAQIKKRIQERIADDLSGIYSFDFDTPEGTSDTDFTVKKETIRKELSELLEDDDLSEEILAEVKQASIALQKITELSYLTTFDSVTVTRLLNQIDAFKDEQAQKKAAFRKLFARYEALCAMSEEEPKEFTYSEDTITAITVEVGRLERALVQQQEQIYISESVDEVMAEMGYDLIGSREVMKRSGKRFRNELFTFHEGTAVNVTFSPNGQISMELGGIAREDRIPTAEETEILTHDMEKFCGEFAEFEKRLRAKGIVVGDRIALAPPVAEYATIINMDDYDVSGSEQISEMNARYKRHKAAEKKVMRRNE